jgi:hypothetical protein
MRKRFFTRMGKSRQRRRRKRLRREKKEAERELARQKNREVRETGRGPMDAGDELAAGDAGGTGERWVGDGTESIIIGD